MSEHELESFYLRVKNDVLKEMRSAKEEWLSVWRKAEGDLTAEAELIHHNLKIQLIEARALEKFAELEEKVKRAVEEDGAS
jgi:hypothetical protein